MYPWLVFVHVLAAFGFVLAHGVSGFVAFRLRAERDRHRLTLLLDLSRLSSVLSIQCLLVLSAAGLAAGLVGGWFGQLWIWTATGVLVAVTAVMLVVAAPYYNRLRLALGQPQPGRGAARTAEPASAAELAVLLDSRRPEVIAAIGGAGLALILWLMVLKPF